MVAAFKQELVQPILEGHKIHTFREGQRWRLGLDVQFVINNRTPQRAEFRAATPLVSWQRAELREEGLYINNHLLDPLELTLFARQDGFATSELFLAFFAKRVLPLKGQLLHWTDFRYLDPQESASPERVADYLYRLVAAQQDAEQFPIDEVIGRGYFLALGRHFIEQGHRCTTANVVAGLRWDEGAYYRPYLPTQDNFRITELPVAEEEYPRLLTTKEVDTNVNLMLCTLDEIWDDTSGDMGRRDELADEATKKLVIGWLK
jgi:hypothetical protein